MGGSSSRPDVAGYRVMRVEESSPASAASSSWVPYLDVLTQAGGQDLAGDSSVLSSQLRAHIGRPLVLTVVNAKSGQERQITVIPSENWGGEGLLGLQVRYDAVDAPGAPDDGEDEEWALHVVSVDESSPAAQAGLVAMDDFILGSHDLAFADMAALSDYIYRCAGEEVILYLYRSSCDTVFTRLISIPESGVLGVELASGRLHALPNRETDGFSEDGGRVEGDSSSSAGAGAGLGAGLESHNTSGIERRGMEEFLANGGGSANTSLEHPPYSGSSSSSSSSSSGALAQQAHFPCPEDQATGRCSMLPNCPYSHASAGAISSAYASSGAFPQSPAANRQAPQLLLPPQQQQQQQQFQPQQQQTQPQPQPQQYQPQQQYFQPQPQQAPGAYSPAPGPAPWQPAPIRIPGAEQPPASQHPSAHTPSFTPGSAVPSSARSAATMLQPPPLPQFQQQYASPHPPLPRSPAPTSNYQARTPGLLPPPSPAFQGRG